MAFDFFYPLSEASSGTTPTTTADSGASGPDLTIDYGPGDMTWGTAASEGNGLNWTVTSAQSSDARAHAAMGSSLAAAMDGATHGCFFFKHNTFTSDYWSVAFSIEASGVSVIELQRDGTGIWSFIFQNNSLAFYNGATVLAVALDTTQASLADRIKFYTLSAGVLSQITPDGGYGGYTLPQNTAIDVVSTDTITIGNRAAVNRNGTGLIKCVGWENSILSEATIEDYLLAIDADDDTMPSAGDTTAPVLTSAVGTTTGSTTATIGATTDEANGTMYGVVTGSVTQPSVAQIKAGQDHTGAAASYASSQSISSTGAKTFSATGLTASTTYYGHIVHTDAAANDSNRLSSASFTTDAASTSKKRHGSMNRGMNRGMNGR